MNIVNISLKNRKRLIEALEFSSFLLKAYRHLTRKYPNSKNPLIKSSLGLLDWCWYWQYDQVEDYRQLLEDYPFWESRHSSRERMRKFVAYELSARDFVAEVFYPSLSDTNEGQDLEDDFRGQANIELDPKSLGFSEIISGLIPFLEGFDEDPEESFWTEEEFREIIQNSWMKVEKYFINES